MAQSERMYYDMDSFYTSLRNDSEYNSEFHSNRKPKDNTASRVCAGCMEIILGTDIFVVDGECWHPWCLKCHVCHVGLQNRTSCYLRDGHVYCWNDYQNVFGTRCGKCSSRIESKDWVRRSRDNIYHLACFSCNTCQRQLSTGDEFALHDNRLLCKPHYLSAIQSRTGKVEKTKLKRNRTRITSVQVEFLQANFDMNTNPDGPSLDRMGQITGLERRVVQVWFQNARAKQRREDYHNTPVSSPDSTRSESIYVSD